MQSFALALDGDRLLQGGWVFSFGFSEEELADQDATFGGIRLYAAIKPLFQLDHAAYLRVMHACSEKAETAYDKADADYIEQIIADAPRTCVLSRMLAPAFDKGKANHLTMVAYSRLARIGLRALRHHADTGAYPETLAEMGNMATLKDPYTREAFKLAVKDRGFICYSVGQNLKDDKGIRDGRRGDLVWSTGLKWKLNE